MIEILADAGLDVVHPFDAHAAAREPGLELLADPERPLGYLIGNTRAFWPRFLAARRADPELAASEHPIQHYVEVTLAKLADAASARAWFPHRQYDGRYLPFQLLAEAAGLGVRSPTQLVIHHELGPWLGLRAVVTVAGEPVTRVLPAPACRCELGCSAAFARARDATGPEAWRAWLAVRDACVVGRAHRYGDDQIAYHYTKDHAFLK